MANIYTDIKLFDAEYYLANNADVAAAIEGTDVTAQDHYFLHGAAENRAPNSWFNAAEYVAQNADLAGVDANLLLAHFALHGVNEGRAPNAATAGADGKIKPELLADYVNAEGNEDVKAAIAEITGTPVGAELTAEQATIAAQHFFTYGINEGRKGGIADEISGDDDADMDAIVKALDAYKDALTAQAAADNAEQDVAAKAAAAKLVAEAGKDEKYDIDEVAKTIATTLANDGDLNEAVREAAVLEVDPAADSLLPSSLEINEKSIAFVKDAQASALKTAQQQVDLLKAQNAAVVTLQEKLVAYKAVATEINKTVIDTEAAFDKFDLDNEEATAKLSFKKAVAKTEGTDAVPATYSAEVKVSDTLTLTLTFDDKGKLVVKKGDDKASDADVAELNKLEGVDALKAALTAAQGNIAAQAAAEKAIANATIAALKDAGYKVYDANGKVDAWSKVKIEDGKLVAAKEGETGYTLKVLGADGQPADAGKVDLNAVLFTVKPIAEAEGKVDLEDAADLGNGLPKAITDAAADSKEAVDAVAEITKAMKAFDEAVAKYNEAAELQKELEAATKNVEAADKAVVEAEKAFADLDVNLVKADEDGVASGETYNEDDAEQFADLFVFSTTLKTVNDFDGEDLFYFGDAAVALIPADKADLAAGKQLGGKADVLEIFAVQDGANTVLYVEKEAFAGNSSNLVDENNKDFVKIELVGVNAADLEFNDGFLTFA